MRVFGYDLTLKKSAPAGTVPLRSSLWGMIREPFAGGWQKGVTVDPIGSVASYGAVFSCISRIASDVSKLEMKLTMPENGIRVAVPATSPYWEALRKPNPHQNRIQFLTYWIVSKLLFGNAYALKVRDARGITYRLHLLDPRRVTPMVTPEGDVYYSIGSDDLNRLPTGLVVPARELIHDRGITLWHPLIGVSPIYACGMSATQGIRIQGNSATFFENMSRPSGMVTAPGTIDDVTADRIKREWEANYSGANLGRLAIMGDGLKYEPMTIPANDAQLVQQLGWTVEDVARCFQVPLYKINAGPIPTAGNVEALELQYYSGCLQVLLEAIELCVTEGMELPAGYKVEFDLEGLLRMDASTQIDVLTKAVGGTIMKPNEARAKRNLPPVEGGDTVYSQQQNFSLAALAKRDAQQNPFAPSSPPPAPAPAELPEDPEDDEDDESDDDDMADQELAYRAKDATAQAIQKMMEAASV